MSTDTLYDMTYAVTSSTSHGRPIKYHRDDLRDLLSQDDMLAVAELDIDEEHEVPRLGAPHLFVRRVS